jgi:hypothetical protein
MIPITRAWHIVDVALGIGGTKEEPSLLNVARLIFAVVGLAGNVVIEKQQLKRDVIEMGGIKWKRL